VALKLFVKIPKGAPTYSMVLKQGVLGGFFVTLPPEMLTVTRESRDDQLSGRRHGTVYCLIFGFAQGCGLLDTFPMVCVGSVKGVLESSCVVVAARGPWIRPIPSRRCNTDSLNIGLG
jgi:hypothetical protein